MHLCLSKLAGVSRNDRRQKYTHLLRRPSRRRWNYSTMVIEMKCRSLWQFCWIRTSCSMQGHCLVPIASSYRGPKRQDSVTAPDRIRTSTRFCSLLFSCFSSFLPPGRCHISVYPRAVLRWFWLVVTVKSRLSPWRISPQHQGRSVSWGLGSSGFKVRNQRRPIPLTCPSSLPLIVL